MEEIIIPKSNKKILLLILFSILFIIVGYWLFFEVADNPTNYSVRRYSPFTIKAVSILGFILGALGLVTSFINLLNNKPALMINQNGIYIYFATSVTLIEWKDITDITTESVKSTQFLLIHIKNPEAYIEKANKLSQVLLKNSLKMYGTPISISSVAMKYNFEELESVIHKSYDYYTVNIDKKFTT